jgi:hypothetical protein
VPRCSCCGGVLHVWVGYEGLHQYDTAGTVGQWMTVVGGSAMLRAAFQMATAPATLFAQGQLLLNFTMDFGVLGLFVGWMMARHPSWLAFGLGTVVVGIADISFLILLVMSGVIAFSLPVAASALGLLRRD